MIVSIFDNYFVDLATVEMIVGPDISSNYGFCYGFWVHRKGIKEGLFVYPWNQPEKQITTSDEIAATVKAELASTLDKWREYKSQIKEGSHVG